jgi:hypothetical protein
MRACSGVAPEVAVRKHFVHITLPPDARYAPLRSQNRRPLFPEVRALVVPVVKDRNTKYPVLPQVSHP